MAEDTPKPPEEKLPAKPEEDKPAGEAAQDDSTNDAPFEDDAPYEDDEPWEDDEEDDLEGRMPFMSHLEELRNRFVKAFVAVIAGFVAAFFFKEQLFYYLTKPLLEAMPKGSKFIFTSPPEAFFTYLKIAFLAGIVGASPVIFYQLWRFVGPGLHPHEKKSVWPFVIVSSLLFMVGAVFCFTVVFPFAFQFFMGFSNEYIQAMPSLKDSLNFSAMMLFAFGLVFELPLVLTFLGRIGVVTSAFLSKNRKYAILIMFIVGAMFTPPDVVTQCMLAIPLILLYEVSIWLVKATEKKKAAKAADEESEWDKD